MSGRLLPPGTVYEVPYHQLAMRKVAAMAGDLRKKGMGGVKRPAFPTEDSKLPAFGSLRKDQSVGQAGGTMTPGLMQKPGPSLHSIVPKVH